TLAIHYRMDQSRAGYLRVPACANLLESAGEFPTVWARHFRSAAAQKSLSTSPDSFPPWPTEKKEQTWGAASFPAREIFQPPAGNRLAHVLFPARQAPRRPPTRPPR